MTNLSFVSSYMVDSISICIGAILGTPPVTAFVESGAGIGEGGKTGLTAMTTGVCFFISIFFAPIFASIPPWATGCVLVLVGSMMTLSVTEINWRYLGDSIPAFVTIALMPFTYSIADGLIAGVCVYIVLNTTVWVVEKISGGRIVPKDKHLKEAWTYKIPGGVLPPWLVRLTKGKRDFWREEERSEFVGQGESRKSGSLQEGEGEAGEKNAVATAGAEPVSEKGDKDRL